MTKTGIAFCKFLLKLPFAKPHGSRRSRFLTLLQIYAINLRLLVVPLGLSASWVGGVEVISSWEQAMEPSNALPIAGLVLSLVVWLLLGVTGRSSLMRHTVSLL